MGVPSVQVGKGARLVQVIGPAVQLKNDDGKPSGDIYQLNGVERGQVGTVLEKGWGGIWHIKC